MTRLNGPLVALAALLTGGVHAQDLDSLERVWSDPLAPDSARFAALYDLVWDGYLFSAPDTAEDMARALQREARAKNDVVFEARSSELIAAVHYVRGDMRTALLHYDTALHLHERNLDDDGQADVLTNMANLRSFLGENDTAIALLARGMAMHERLMDSASIANDLNSLGRLQMIRGDHARAVDLYMRSLRIQEKLGNKRGISTALGNLGGLYINQGDWTAALEHLRRALKLSEELYDKHQIGKQLEEVGSCLEELGDTAAAMRAFRRSEAVRAGIEDGHGLVNVRNRIGSLLLRQQQHREALALFERNAAMARADDLPRGLGNALIGKSTVLLATGDPEGALAAAIAADSAAGQVEERYLLRDAAQARYAALKALGRWREALLVHETMVGIEDSLRREENQRALLRNEYRSAYERAAEADSLRHAAEKERVVAAHREQRLWMLALLGVIATVGISIGLRLRYTARAKRAILEAQDRLIESERRREAEQVRTRIATDIHDDLGSDLSKLGRLGRALKAGSAEDARTIADRMVELSVSASASLSDIVWAADPGQDTALGLVNRARVQVERMLEGTGIEGVVECAHAGADRALNPAERHHLIMILKEAVHNAIKHARPGRIRAVLHTDDAGFDLRVEDDGRGFDPDNTARGTGTGSMGTRAQRLGAELDLATAPGQGCSLRVHGAWKPLHPPVAVAD